MSMQATPQNLQNLAALFSQIQQGSNIKQAEQTLASVQSKPGFASCLLALSSSPQHLQVAHASTIYLKNLVKRRWNNEEDPIIPEEKEFIRSKILGLIILPHLTRPLQHQLAECVLVICEHEFFNDEGTGDWKQFLTQFVQKINECLANNNQNLKALYILLYCANLMFDRYQEESLTEELGKEIWTVMDVFADSFMKVFMFLVNATRSMKTQTFQSAAKKQEITTILFENLHLCCQIFCSLTWIDLSDFFCDPNQDTLSDSSKTFMNGFLEILELPENAFLSQEDLDDEFAEGCGPFLQSKEEIFKIANLFMSKYETFFDPYIPRFAKSIWSQILKFQNLPSKKTFLLKKFDTFCCNALTFLTTVTESPKYELFSDEATLCELVEHVIIPNLRIREEVEEEIAENDPIEYILRDIEGSDTGTRRKSALELLKTLFAKFEDIVTNIVQKNINLLVSNEKKPWKQQDMAIQLTLAITIKTFTTKKGTTKLNPKVPLIPFIEKTIIPNLAPETKEIHPILRADCIKFITFFRFFIPKQKFIQDLLPKLIEHLKNPNRIIHTYAAWSIDKFFQVREESEQNILIPQQISQRDKKIGFFLCFFSQIFLFLANFFKKQNRKLRYTKDDLNAQQKQLVVSSLFESLKFSFPSDANEQKQTFENEHVMMAIFRVSYLFKEDISSLLPQMVSFFSNVVTIVCKNPKNPQFNHYLFNTYGSLIKNFPQNIASFEQALFPVFHLLFSQNIEEFTPYVLQLLSQMLNIRSKTANFNNNELPKIYVDVFQQTITPNTQFSKILWENLANIPPMIHFISFMLEFGKSVVTQGNNIDFILYRFDKLINSKKFDHEGFKLLHSIIKYLPYDTVISKHMKAVWSALFKRLEKKPTAKYLSCLGVFFCYFSCVHSAETLISSIEELRNGLFVQVFGHLLSKSFQNIKIQGEKKICVMGLIRMLKIPFVSGGNEKVFPFKTSKEYQQIWQQMVTTILQISEVGNEKAAKENEILEKEDDDEDIFAKMLEGEQDDENISGDFNRGYQIKYKKLMSTKEKDDLFANVKDIAAEALRALSEIAQKGDQQIGQFINSVVQQHKMKK